MRKSASRNVWAVLLVVCSLAVVAAGIVLNTTFLAHRSLRRAVAQYLPGYTMSELSIRRQRGSPAGLTLRDLHLKLETQDRTKFPRKIVLDVAGIKAGIGMDRSGRLEIEGLDLQTEAFSVKGAGFQADLQLKGDALSGPLTIPLVSAQGRKVTDIKMTVLADPKSFQLKDITARSYGGDIKGQVTADLQPEMTNVHVDLRGARFNSKLFKGDSLVLSGDIALAGKDISAITGQCSAQGIVYRGYKMDNFTSPIVGDGQTVRLEMFKAEAYRGRFAGRLVVSYRPALSYDLSVDVSELFTRELAELNQSLFSQVDGTLAGVFKAQGDPQQVRSVDLQAAFPKGGQIRAALLSFIVQYLPARSQQKIDMETLLSMDGMVPAEILSLDLKNAGEDKLKGMCVIGSKELNLKINLPLDINTGTKIASLPEYWQQVLEGLGRVMRPGLAR